MHRFVALLPAAMLALPAHGQERTIELLLKHWKTSAEFTKAVADLMPAESYDFQPNAEEMGFGALMIHIADANNRNIALVAGVENPLPKVDKTDKATAMKYLDASFEFALATIAKLTREDLDRMTGPEGRQMSGVERIWAYFTHTAHHRGQAEVYLRVKNIKPPAYRF